MKLEKVLTYKKGKSPFFVFESEKQVLYLTPEYLRGNTAGNFISDFPGKVEVEDGDLLLLWDGSNAGEFFKGKSGVLSSTMVKFNFSLNVFNHEFLFYQLKGFEGYIKSQTNGTGIPHVDRELLLGLEVKEFKETEQSHIAEILSTADVTIANTEALIDKYQRIKTGLMQDLLTRGIDERGNIRNKATHKFTVKNGLEVPEEWDVDLLLNKCEVFGGKRLPKDHTYAEGNEGFRYLRVLDFYKKEVDYYSLENLKKETYEILKRYEIHPYELFISIAGSIGYIGVLRPPVSEKIILTENALRIVPQKQIISDYLALLLNSDGLQRQIWSEIGTGGGVPKLAMHRVQTLRICIPSFNEQLKIVEKMDTVSKLLKEHKNNLDKLLLIKIGLMQDLLSGRVRVPEEMIKQT